MAERIEIHPEQPDPRTIERIAGILRDGGLVAYPTETFYGLGADAMNPAAVDRVFAAKGRDFRSPVGLVIGRIEDLDPLVAEIPAAGRLLMDAFWPGPLTLVLRLREGKGLSPLVTADLPTVALRVPAHPVAHALLAAFGGPVAAPSANPSGKVSPTRPEHVLEGLSGRIAAVVDGGACAVGVESTIVGLDGEAALLRPGGIPAEAIEACLGRPLAQGGSAEKPSAPGQLASHYAPAARVRLDAATPAPGEVWLSFGAGNEGLPLSPTGDLIEAAANLFHLLREADRRAGPQGAIAVAPIPDHGLGRAINDRLRRAAAPRP